MTWRITYSNHTWEAITNTWPPAFRPRFPPTIATYTNENEARTAHARLKQRMPHFTFHLTQG